MDQHDDAFFLPANLGLSDNIDHYFPVLLQASAEGKTLYTRMNSVKGNGANGCVKYLIWVNFLEYLVYIYSGCLYTIIY